MNPARRRAALAGAWAGTGSAAVLPVRSDADSAQPLQLPAGEQPLALSPMGVE